MTQFKLRLPNLLRGQLRSRPSAIRGTRFGFVYIGLIFLVALAATNTGNNTLFMVLALLLGLLAVSGFVSRSNVRGLQVELEAPVGLFANRPFRLGLQLRNRARWWPRWFLVLQAVGQPPEHAAAAARKTKSGKKRSALENESSSSSPWFVSRLAPRTDLLGSVPCVFRQRGRQRLRGVRVISLFPFGLFQKGQLYRTETELLIYPELFPAGTEPQPQDTNVGPSSRQRRGWGHDLHELRGFREGDDPRNIHWKRSARTGDLVYKEREAEEGRRLAILFDNRVDPTLFDKHGRWRDVDDLQRFERLVSEAATAADAYLDAGYELELVTRRVRLPFSAGTRQRLAVLEALALVQPETEGASEAPRSSDERAPILRLGLESTTREAA